MKEGTAGVLLAWDFGYTNSHATTEAASDEQTVIPDRKKSMYLQSGSAGRFEFKLPEMPRD